jgi:hypothetical protein
MAETRVAAQSRSGYARTLIGSIDRRGLVGQNRRAALGFSRPAWCGIRCRVSKKVAEFLGEEEKTLIDFIIDKVEQHSPPSAIAEELQDVLEKDAEMFTIKMWRVLLFELIQARLSVRVVVPWALCVPGMAGGSDWSTHRSNRPTLNPAAALRPPTRVLVCHAPPARSVTVATVEPIEPECSPCAGRRQGGVDPVGCPYAERAICCAVNSSVAHKSLARRAIAQYTA